MIGIIYRLEGGGKFYIGSTTSNLKDRLKKHRAKSNEATSTNRASYVHFKQIGWSNVTITPICEINVSCRKELLIKECEFVKTHINDENCLNKNLPVTTSEEKKIRDAEYGRRRRLENPERERLRVKKWRSENPDKWKLQYTSYHRKQTEQV
jgi:predicted GIY-YIG superfamily endonuclease